jgi:hypothetical protein
MEIPMLVSLTATAIRLTTTSTPTMANVQWLPVHFWLSVHFATKVEKAVKNRSIRPASSLLVRLIPSSFSYRASLSAYPRPLRRDTRRFAVSCLPGTSQRVEEAQEAPQPLVLPEPMGRRVDDLYPHRDQ